MYSLIGSERSHMTWEYTMKTNPDQWAIDKKNLIKPINILHLISSQKSDLLHHLLSRPITPHSTRTAHRVRSQRDFTFTATNYTRSLHNSRMKLWITSPQSQAESGLKFKPSRHLAVVIYTSNYPVMLGCLWHHNCQILRTQFWTNQTRCLFQQHRSRSSVTHVKIHTTHCRHFASMQSDKTIGDVKCWRWKWN